MLQRSPSIRLQARSRRSSAPVRGGAAALLVAAASLAACSAEPDPVPGRPPSVLLISLDTLRADHLSCYGYARETTPRLDRLAGSATRYTDCIATAPWTVPSHASMMTGRFPSEHGAITAKIERREGVHPSQLDNAQPLAPGATTLAEVLRDEGYATAGFVANFVYLRPQFGLSQGFDSWVVAEPWMRREASPAWSPWVTRSAVRWVETHVAEDGDQPFFLFLNYIDTHRPYNIAPDSAHESFQALDELCARVMYEGQPPGDSAVRTIDHFDRALTTLDASLGELFDRLEELGVFDDMLVIVTSDHGEYFGEHGLVEHSKDVYQAGLHVPLIVKQPRQRDGRVDERRVSLVDIPRLVLDALPAPARELREAFPYAVGEHVIWAENHFSRPRDLFHEKLGTRFHRRRLALYDGTFKLIYSSDGAHELYDLAVDPGERRNLRDELPERARGLEERARELLQRSQAASAAAQGRELTPEEARLLESMGYGGAADEDD